MSHVSVPELHIVAAESYGVFILVQRLGRLDNLLSIDRGAQLGPVSDDELDLRV